MGKRDKNLVRWANAKAQDQKKQFILSCKDVPCAVCGIKYPSCAMDFHHRDAASKSGNVGQAYSTMGWDRMVEEVNKCDVICVLCHRLHTWSSGYNRPVELALWQSGII